jgi:hypothetical protein
MPPGANLGALGYWWPGLAIPSGQDEGDKGGNDDGGHAVTPWVNGAGGRASRCSRAYRRTWAGVQGIGPPGGGNGQVFIFWLPLRRG